MPSRRNRTFVGHLRHSAAANQNRTCIGHIGRWERPTPARHMEQKELRAARQAAPASGWLNAPRTHQTHRGQQEWGHKGAMSNRASKPDTNPTNATRQPWPQAGNGTSMGHMSHRPSAIWSLSTNASAMVQSAHGQDGVPAGIAPETRQTCHAGTGSDSRSVSICVHPWSVPHPISGGI
jgi:hypothetical protein